MVLCARKKLISFLRQSLERHLGCVILAFALAHRVDHVALKAVECPEGLLQFRKNHSRFHLGLRNSAESLCQAIELARCSGRTCELHLLEWDNSTSPEQSCKISRFEFIQAPSKSCVILDAHSIGNHILRELHLLQIALYLIYPLLPASQLYRNMGSALLTYLALYASPRRHGRSNSSDGPKQCGPRRLVPVHPEFDAAICIGNFKRESLARIPASDTGLVNPVGQQHRQGSNQNNEKYSDPSFHAYPPARILAARSHLARAA